LVGAASLAVGLTAASLVFALVNVLLFAPIPGTRGDTAAVEIGRSSAGSSFESFSLPDFIDVRERARTLRHVFATSSKSGYLGEPGSVQRISTLLVSADYFVATGTRAALGRLLGADDMRAQEPAPVVLSDNTFRRIFSGNPAVIGRDIKINGRAFVVVGVTETDFSGLAPVFPTEVFVPMPAGVLMNVPVDAAALERASRWLRVGARLAPGASLEQARAELRSLAATLRASHPESNTDVDFDLAPQRILPAAGRTPLLVLAGVLAALAVLTLLLAAVNLGGLLLAQGEQRMDELAIRSALGARRRQIAVQLQFEAILIAAVAAFASVILTWLMRDVLSLLPLPGDLDLDLHLVVDWRVVAFCCGLALCAATAFGLVPALRLSALAPGRGLAAARSTASRSKQRGRLVLLATQAALTTVLLGCAVLVLRGLERADAIDPGIEIEGLSIAGADLEPIGLTGLAAAARIDAVIAELRTQAEIRAASYASVVPLTLNRDSPGWARRPGAPESEIEFDANSGGADLLRTLGVRFRGRDIAPGDRPGAEPVAVINQQLAQRLFGERDAIGLEFEFGSKDRWQRVRVIGVAADGRYASLYDTERPFAFFAAAQWPRSEYTVFIRSGADTATLAGVVRGAMMRHLPELPAPVVERYVQAANLSLLPQRIGAVLASALGAVALMLAVGGLYTILAYQLACRLRELAIRLALGATRTRIVLALVKTSGMWTAVGLVLGVLALWLIGMVAAPYLMGQDAGDPVVAASVLATIVAVCGLGIGLPLVRLRRLTAAEALRHE
jgi:putative ABC transport system permease protein